MNRAPVEVEKVGLDRKWLRENKPLKVSQKYLNQNNLLHNNQEKKLQESKGKKLPLVESNKEQKPPQLESYKDQKPHQLESYKDQKLHQLESIKDQKHPLPQENKESDLIFSKSKKFIIKKPYFFKFEKFQSETLASFLIQI